MSTITEIQAATGLDWFASPASLLSALTQDIRSDGVKYWRFSDRACMDMPGELNEFFYELHDDEGPNDWRYDTIVSILEALINTDDLEDWDHHDLACGIADNITDIYNSDLFQWYADQPDRVGYIEEATAEGLITEDTDTIARLTIGQHECIRSMTHRIIDRFM